MEALVRDIVEQLKKTIAFLDKLKIDKKQKPDRDAIVNDLNVTLRRCQTSLRGDVRDGDTYDDVGPTNGKSADDVYDDVGDNYDDVESTLPRPPPADDIYDDTGDDGMTYDDVSSAPLSGKEIPLVECESLKNPTIADFMELKKDKSLIKSPWQKRWCVLHLGILYMFENTKDKRQKEAFRIKGCKFKLRDDITKETKRKDRCFEVKISEKIYQFCANDKESLHKWRFAFGGKASSSLSSSLSGSIEDNYDDVSVERGPSKKKLGFPIPLIGRKRPSKSPTKSAGGATDDGDLYEESYDDIGNRTYDDTGNQTYDDAGSRTYDDTGSRTYDDTGAQTYDDTGSYPAPPEEADDLYEETAAPPVRDHLPLPPPPTSLPQRRTSTKDELPPIPGSPKPHGFPLSPPSLPSREETGSASGTYRRNRPPMPLPGDPPTSKRELPPQPGQDPPRTSPPTTVHQPPVPPPVANEFPGDGDLLDAFGEEKEDYVNMYQGMWDCEPNESNELRFKRGEVIHILSKEYDDYGWWTAESCHQEIGLVPIGYLMKAYDI